MIAKKNFAEVARMLDAGIRRRSMLKLGGAGLTADDSENEGKGGFAGPGDSLG